ncbi:prepilin peptidase [Candidatus Parcubacteria bacterium]|nr:prepilin peptidase [Patescibacteria group bacterium]MCG2699364.1 prepilin peptidase [Candidatus Parcubacteria bacterium]
MILIYILIFIFGTIIGSFLNVVILRYNTGESIIKDGSRCFICGNKLKWHELIPIFSFLAQKGKCRNCKSKISIQYPVVEIITGLLFLATFLVTRYSLLVTGYYFLIFSLLIIIAVYDFRHQIIPNLFVYSFNILAFLNLFGIWNLEFGIFKTWHFLAGIIFFSFFGLFWLISKGAWMGLGDAKLALGIGWLLGFSKGLPALMLAFWIGAAVGIFLLFFFKKSYNIKSKLAFGPFLALGTLIAFLFGEAIISLII